jgi:hypothetical protein
MTMTINRLILVAAGIAPDRNQIYINQSLRDASDFEIAVILAHEMKHIDQYRGAASTDAFKCDYTRKFIDCGLCQDDKHPLERAAYEFEERARAILSIYYGEDEKSFSGEGFRSLLGTYGVAAGGCQPRRGPAVIFEKAGSVLVARNECGNDTPLLINPDDSFTATSWGNLRGKFVSSLSAVMWANGSQWIRTQNSYSLIGVWNTVQAGGCAPVRENPRVYIRADGILVARNECGNESSIRLNEDGSFNAIDWGNIRASTVDQGRTIVWSNSSRWLKN